MQCNEKEEIVKRKAEFYYSMNLKCHVKIKPTGFRNGKIKSTSGITERKKIKGISSFTFNNLAIALPKMYPSAKCPTAKNL